MVLPAERVNFGSTRSIEGHTDLFLQKKREEEVFWCPLPWDGRRTDPLEGGHRGHSESCAFTLQPPTPCLHPRSRRSGSHSMTCVVVSIIICRRMSTLYSPSSKRIGPFVVIPIVSYHSVRKLQRFRPAKAHVEISLLLNHRINSPRVEWPTILKNSGGRGYRSHFELTAESK